MDIRCIVITSLEDLNKHIQDIRLLQKAQRELEVNGAIDHAVAIIEHSSDIVSPYFIIGYSENKPVGMLLARIESTNIEMSLGYLNFPPQKRNAMVFIYGGLIESDSREVNEQLSRQYICEIHKSVTSLNVDVIKFNSMNTDTVFYETLKNKELRFLSISSQPNLHYQFILPASPDDFYATKSKGHRKNIIYYSRKLEKEFSSVEVKCFRTENELSALLYDVEKIAQKTYQRGLGVGFIQTKVTEKRFLVAVQNGWLRSYVLYLDKKPACFQLGFQYKSGYYVQGKGYDPQYRPYRLGIYLFVKMLEDFYTDKTITLVDFGIGDAEYKDVYGNKKWLECSLIFFSPNVKNMLLYSLLVLTTRTNCLFLRVLQKTNLLNKIKKVWRLKKERTLH